MISLKLGAWEAVNRPWALYESKEWVVISSLAILMTCHNRMTTTVDCLKYLFAAVTRLNTCECKVFLVDDGSTDGTAEAVRKYFPQVCVIGGDGTLFWARGMELAWKSAEVEGEWDGYLWLNDDTILAKDALERLMSADDGESIVVGNLRNAVGAIVYGMREGGLFTGNCVFVPRKVYGRLGMICGKYSHAWADSDYAMRAKRYGVKVVSGGVVGSAEWHPNRPSLKGRTLCERVRLLCNPKGWNLHDLWLYRSRNWGVFRAVTSCAHLMIHVVWGER